MKLRVFIGTVLFATMALAAPRIIQSPTDDGVVIDGGTKAVNVTTRIEADTTSVGAGDGAKFHAKSATDSYGYSIESDNGSGDRIGSSWISVNSDTTNYTLFRTSSDGFSSFSNNLRLYANGGVVLGAQGASNIVNDSLFITSTDDANLNIRSTSSGDYGAVVSFTNAAGATPALIGIDPDDAGVLRFTVAANISPNAIDNESLTRMAIFSTGTTKFYGDIEQTREAYIQKNQISYTTSQTKTILDFTSLPVGCYLTSCKRSGASIGTRTLNFTCNPGTGFSLTNDNIAGFVPDINGLTLEYQSSSITLYCAAKPLVLD